MVDGINGKFSKGLNFFTQKELSKNEETKEVKQNVPVGKQTETKELGDDLLDPRYYASALGFVKQGSALSPEKKQDYALLSEISCLNLPTPTAAQYASVAGFTTSFQKDIDTLSTTNNAKQLFASSEFEALNKQFGIS